ncbi:MAG: alpha/beta hydrolase [Spirochaetaceae bacterium]|nr:MAG: alpha/beta hydrolase [Spirochaetaceae bacterium]
MKTHDRLRTRPKIVRIAAIAFILTLVFFVTRALLFPQHELPIPTGPYAVATVRFTYTDENRIEVFARGGQKRKVNLTVWHPQPTGGPETFPLVVSSHGGLGLETANESLYLELASHGFVVFAIGHPHHALWTRDADGRITFVNREYFRALQRENARSDREQSLAYYREWMAVRTGDINLVLDSILRETDGDADGVYGLVDVRRIAVIGHSLGGSAALAMPRLRDDISAVIALEAPFLYDIVGVADGEFVWLEQAYSTPVLNIYSDSSWDHLSEWPQYGRNAAWLAEPPAAAINLHLPGAGHFSLTDLVLVSPLLVRLLEGEASGRNGAAYLQAVNQACREFLVRQLGRSEE